MSKSRRSYENDSYGYEDYRDDKPKNKRKDRRLERALRTKDVNQLAVLNDEDDGYDEDHS